MGWDLFFTLSPGLWQGGILSMGVGWERSENPLLCQPLIQHTIRAAADRKEGVPTCHPADIFSLGLGIAPIQMLVGNMFILVDI